VTPFRAGVLAGVVLTLALLGAAGALAALARNPTEKRMAIFCGAALVVIGVTVVLFPGLTCRGG
jgi:hypothetical protein